MTATIDMPVELEDYFGYKALSWKVTKENIRLVAVLFGGSLVSGSQTAYQPYAVKIELPSVRGLDRYVRLGEYITWREDAGLGIHTAAEYNLYYS